ncbi:hypothetical protein HanXRQr2_Chr04g0143571 [Helianthus annuus]|uniref:Uncharacterized protein n=1 Tax=Helianthus annuus TaxID=4232 RepID=A0A9K3J4G8_HELAN|nr:hypothetical protein HanXRQr2_Chr04g0143571 [Helianthus annuus]
MAVSYSLVEFFDLLLVFVFSSKDLLSRIVVVNMTVTGGSIFDRSG